MYDFVFRFDAHEGVGAGHFYRALALIQALKTRGFSVACCGEYTVYYQDHFRRQHLPYFPVESALQMRCLVFDYYGDIDAYISSGVSFENMVVFEDLPERGHCRANLVVNAFGDEQDLKKRYPSAVVCCGIEFLLFRERVYTLKQKMSLQLKQSQQKKVLVSLGGTDQSGILRRVLSVLCELLDPDVQIRVLSPVQVNVPDRCLLHVGFVDDFLERAIDSDLVICGLGQSFLEMLALGQDCIGLKLAENQAACANTLALYSLNIVEALERLELTLRDCLRAEFPQLIISDNMKHQLNSDKNKKMTIESKVNKKSTLNDKLGSQTDYLIEKMVALLS